MNALSRLLLGAYQQRFHGVDKPQFYNAWEPNADPMMNYGPAQNHPAMNDKMIMRPEDAPPPSFLQHGRQDFSALARIMNVG